MRFSFLVASPTAEMYKGAVVLRETLRYWLGMIRHEEAMGLKVRAAPPIKRGSRWEPNLLDPSRGRAYFKLPCGREGGAEGFLARADEVLELPIVDDRGEFFEHWLRGSYIAQRFRQGVEDIGLTSMVAGFPVLFDARKGELTTLLRLPLSELLWLGEDGEPWHLPSLRARRRGTLPTPPATVRLKGDDEADLPLAIDEIVLSRTLGVQEEDIGELVRGLEGRTDVEPDVMIQSVTALLKGTSEVDDGEPTSLELLEGLAQAATERVVYPRVRVWPMGIVYDGSSNLTTHYLQQDLRGLIREADDVEEGTAFHAYMTGARTPIAEQVHLGRRGDRRLTDSQRAAAQRFLGSQLTTVQGPPGTGKTELILALCAQNLVDRMARCGRGEPPRGITTPLLVVTSTNNRAVDNVTEPLADDLPEDRLPIALRVGSRMVMATVTLACLRRTAGWLEGAEPSKSQYESARRRLRDVVDAVRRVETALLEARRHVRELDDAEEKRDAYQPLLDEALRAPPIEPIPPKTLKAIQRSFKTVRRAVRREQGRFLEGANRETATKKASSKVAKGRLAFNAIRRSIERSLAVRLADLGIPLELPETLDDDASRDAWNEVFREISDVIDRAEDQLDERVAQSRLAPNLEEIRRRCETIEGEIERLRALAEDIEPLEAAVREVVEEQEPGLFEEAIVAREAWAALNKERLLTSVRAAIESLEGAPTFRSMGRFRGEVLDDLLQLFPVFGCTLLSLGNVFPNEPQIISRVVIDEAGQCHPAYAVSAIARAEQALVIGDVNQLEPVIELNEQEEGRVMRKLSLDEDIERRGPFRVNREAHASAQALATRAVAEVLTLREHFRCQPEIIEISNRLCDYDLKVLTPPKSLGDRCHLLRGPVLGIRTSGVQAPYLGSWRNDVEVRSVVDLVRAMIRFGIEPAQIAVLTPYRGQLRALEAALRSAGVRMDSPDRLGAPESPELFDEPSPRGIVVGTLHRFQGGERDVVVLSMVVSRHRSLAFTNSRVNLINVAVSRARHHLIVVGAPSVLADGAVTAELMRSIPHDGWL